MDLKIGQIVDCIVARINAFGIFVTLADGTEGIIHISDLADHPIAHPQEVVAVGDKIEAVVLRIDSLKHRIVLSRKRS